MGWPNSYPRSVIASACVHLDGETWVLQQSRGFAAVETDGPNAVLVLAGPQPPPETITVQVSQVGAGGEGPVAPPILDANAVPITVVAATDFMVEVLRL